MTSSTNRSFIDCITNEVFLNRAAQVQLTVESLALGIELELDIDGCQLGNKVDKDVGQVHLLHRLVGVAQDAAHGGLEARSRDSFNIASEHREVTSANHSHLPASSGVPGLGHEDPEINSVKVIHSTSGNRLHRSYLGDKRDPHFVHSLTLVLSEPWNSLSCRRYMVPWERRESRSISPKRTPPPRRRPKSIGSEADFFQRVICASRSVHDWFYL